MFNVRRALVSVSDKRGLVPFVQGLAELGVEVLSTGGTCRQLREAGLDVIEVSEKTGFPGNHGRPSQNLAPRHSWRPARSPRHR